MWNPWHVKNGQMNETEIFVIFAGGPYRGDPQQQRPRLLQDLPGRLLLWGSPEASLWASRHQLWQQRPAWCWLSGSNGVHLRTGDSLVSQCVVDQQWCSCRLDYIMLSTVHWACWWSFLRLVTDKIRARNSSCGLNLNETFLLKVSPSFCIVFSFCFTFFSLAMPRGSHALCFQTLCVC